MYDITLSLCNILHVSFSAGSDYKLHSLHIHDPKAYQEQMDTQMNNLVGGNTL